MYVGTTHSWHQSTPGPGSPGTQPLYIKIIKSGISDIIIGESCDMEMESGGEVGTLVSWHTVAPGDQAGTSTPHTSTPGLSANNNIIVFISCLMSRNVSHTAQERGK